MKRFVFLALFTVVIFSVGTAQNLFPSSEIGLKRDFSFNQLKFSWYENNYASDNLLRYEKLKDFSLSLDVLRYNFPSRKPVKSLFNASIYSPSFDGKNFWRLGYEDLFGNYNKFVDYVIVFEKGRIKLQKKIIFY